MNSHTVVSTITPMGRTESRPESISTLWSSADVPLFFDSRMERRDSTESTGAGPSRVFMGTPKAFTTLPFISVQRGSLPGGGEEEEEVLSSGGVDGPRSVSSPPSSDYDDHRTFSKPLQRKQRKQSPPHLNLAPPSREMPIFGMPVSVSYSSHLTMTSQKSADSHCTVKEERSPQSAATLNLYEEAEKYFSKSYSMSPTGPISSASMTASNSYDSCTAAPHQRILRSRFSDVGTEDGMAIDAASPPYSRSRDSKSSTESSMLPDWDDSHSHSQSTPTSFTPSSLGKSTLFEGATTSPLQSAVGMAANHAISVRPCTSDAVANISNSHVKPELRHVHTLSDQELSRIMNESKSIEEVEEERNKYDFLHSPAPTPTARKLGLFGSKGRAVSTPRLRSSKVPEEGSAAAAAAASETSTNASENIIKEIRQSQTHPPQSPSGRYRSRTLGESDRPESAGDRLTGQRPSVALSYDAPRVPRRPSSTEALSAAARRLHRPSKAGTTSSSQYNSSILSLHNRSDFYDAAKSSSASSHLNLEGSNRSTSQSKKSTLRSHSSSGNVNRPKSKGGWASHLTQGINLHIEQGSRKFTIKMNYLSYDPFGKPESLCTSEDRPLTPKRPKSKGGKEEKDSSTVEGSVGILEFGPCVELDGNSSSLSRLTMSSSLEEDLILKHVVVGDDTKGDLITRQANLSLCNIGTREVSGSERKGKVTWRFVYGVEQCWNASGHVLEDIKTLRPISFSCSGTLLDPAKAKKFKMINIIRKQIGSHIESTPMDDGLAATMAGNHSCPHIVTKVESPTSTRSFNINSSASASQRSTSVSTTTDVPSAAASAAVLRPGLVPFKMSKPMMEAMHARNRTESEHGSVSTSYITSNPTIGSSCQLTHKTSLLVPSPLSSHFAIQHPSPATKSARELQPSSRLLTPQTHTRARGNSVGQSAGASGALGLDINENRARRTRAVTTAITDLHRPPTASEEIKRAYLLQNSRSDQNMPQRKPLHDVNNSFALHYQHNVEHTGHPRDVSSSSSSSLQHQNQHQHQQQQPFLTSSSSSSHFNLPPQSTRQQFPFRPNTSQVDTREGTRTSASPVASKRYNPVVNSTKFENPEGPFWL